MVETSGGALFVATALLWSARAAGGSGFVPAPRYGHCAFAVNSTMYALGGATIKGPLSAELLRFDEATRSWASVKAAGAGPGAIEGQACTAAPDPGGSGATVVYVTGGNTAAGNTAGPSSKSFALTFAVGESSVVWQALPPMPIAVRRHVAVLDRFGAKMKGRSRLIVFGGSRGPSCHENLTNTLMHFEPGANIATGKWTTVGESGESPPPMMGHAAMISPPAKDGKRYMYVLSGTTANNCSESGFTNDAWALDTALFRWQKLDTSSSVAPPRKRYGATGWWDPAANAPQITGGTCGSACGACGHTNDTFVLHVSRGVDPTDTGKWEQTAATGAGPPPRDRHTSVLIGYPTPHILDWGGFVNGTIYSDTVYSFDLQSSKWMALLPQSSRNVTAVKIDDATVAKVTVFRTGEKGFGCMRFPQLHNVGGNTLYSFVECCAQLPFFWACPQCPQFLRQIWCCAQTTSRATTAMRSRWASPPRRTRTRSAMSATKVSTATVCHNVPSDPDRCCQQRAIRPAAPGDSCR